ncbi:hypothetical protein PIB30_083948 [Stylosanthes scabra]|uniref:Putative plant transposon protein domain-containing protein n=1 Tax=Stylosanthes scabra TaxID=79078 RepID=A0ABU6RTA7_9FABA|nr:hypothetical protein [Stylosanthes scabra]
MSQLAFVFIGPLCGFYALFNDCYLVMCYLMRIVRKGKALVKATTPVPTSSTTRNPSLPLNDMYFDTICQNNAGKLVGRGIVCERPLKFPDAIPDLGILYLRDKMVPFTFAVIHDILEARLWHLIIVTYLDPAQHDNTLSHSTAIMIWALMEEKKINLPRVLKDAVHKVHAGKRQSLALPCLIMKIAHSNRIQQWPGDEMFYIPRAAWYIPYGDWDDWGIQLKKRKKRSEAIPLNQLPALVPKPPTPRRAPDLEPVTPEHEPPSAKRSEDFMDAEGGEDEDQDSEGGVDEAEYAPYHRATKPKEHPDDSTDTASED